MHKKRQYPRHVFPRRRTRTKSGQSQHHCTRPTPAILAPPLRILRGAQSPGWQFTTPKTPAHQCARTHLPYRSLGTQRHPTYTRLDWPTNPPPWRTNQTSPPHSTAHLAQKQTPGGGLQDTNSKHHSPRPNRITNCSMMTPSHKHSHSHSIGSKFGPKTIQRRMQNLLTELRNSHGQISQHLSRLLRRLTTFAMPQNAKQGKQQDLMDGMLMNPNMPPLHGPNH